MSTTLNALMKTYLSYERSGFEGHGAARVTGIQVEKAILRSEHEPCQTATATATAQLCEGAVYNDGAIVAIGRKWMIDM
jgi:hypothetical protein